MRRIVTIGIALFLALISTIIVPGTVLGSEIGQDAFPTNTPRPTDFEFVTNTPLGPTATPTDTPPPTDTATLTPTHTPTPTATFTPSDTPTPTPTPNGPFLYPEGVNPLTGLPYPDEIALGRRNLIIKISNYPPIVRPQYGVNEADVVFEYETESGVTRFAAIYRTNMPERVGPVRSARLMDLNLVPMYQSLLTYSGASEPVQNLLLGAEWRFQLISPSIGDAESNSCESTPFCRIPREGAAFEHTLFANTELLWELATRRNVNTGYRARGFAFSDEPDAGGIPAEDVYVEWWGQADARWQYDPSTQRYVRFTDNVPHLDAADGEQLWANNLIIIEVPHEERPDLFPPGSTYWSLDIQLVDQGFAYLVRDGRAYQGYWRRRSEDLGDALQIIYGDNTPIMMRPGRTWVMVVRGLGQATISETRVDMDAIGTAIAETPTVTPASSDQ